MNNWNPKKEWEKLVVETKLMEASSDDIEVGTVESWEELHDILDLALQKADMEKAAQDTGEAAGRLTKNLMAALPGIGSVWGAMGAVKDIANLAGKLRSTEDPKAEENPIMSSLKIDPGYSEILDNNLEKEFIIWFKDWISKQSGPIADSQSDINSVLEEFLKERGDFDETVVGGESNHSFTDIPVPSDDKVIPKLKSLTKGFLGDVI